MTAINPFQVQHVIHSNASKSDAQRCLILAAFSKNPTRILGLDQSEDISAMLSCIQELGASYDEETSTVHLSSHNFSERICLNVHESGFALRTLAFVGMAFTKNLTINGTGSLLQRDHSQLCHILQQIGFTVFSRQDRHGASDRLIGGFAQSQSLSRIHFGIANFGRFGWLDLSLSR
mgnify:CR=1 FL=1